MMKDIVLFKKPCISVSAGIFAVVVLTMLLDSLTRYLSAFACIVFHEAGHIAAALIFGCRIRQVRILSVGMNAVIEDAEEVEQRIAVYLAGPAVNALLLLLCIFLERLSVLSPEKAEIFAITNILLLIVNLIPVLPLDGGRILKELLTGRLGLFNAALRMRIYSILLAALLALLGILQLLSDKRNFTLLLLAFYILVTSKKGNMEAALMNMKQILYRKMRILRKGVYPARDLVVLKSMKMGDVLKSLDFDRYHFLHVLDEDLKLIRLVSEQELMDAIVGNGAEMTLEEYIKEKLCKPL